MSIVSYGDISPAVAAYSVVRMLKSAMVPYLQVERPVREYPSLGDPDADRMIREIEDSRSDEFIRNREAKRRLDRRFAA